MSVITTLTALTMQRFTMIYYLLHGLILAISNFSTNAPHQPVHNVPLLSKGFAAFVWRLRGHTGAFSAAVTNHCTKWRIEIRRNLYLAYDSASMLCTFYDATFDVQHANCGVVRRANTHANKTATTGASIYFVNGVWESGDCKPVKFGTWSTTKVLD